MARAKSIGIRETLTSLLPRTELECLAVECDMVRRRRKVDPVAMLWTLVLGFGTGNLNDSMLEKITNKGNGQFHYVDRLDEGRRVLVEQMAGSLVTIAKDVKVQIEFKYEPSRRLRFYQFDPFHHDVAIYSIH